MTDEVAWSYFLFNIYISDLEIDLIWSASKFTDDKSVRIFKVDTWRTQKDYKRI